MTEDFDENRELCADGNCLGVVVDGKCNVCGLPAGMNDHSVANPATERSASDEGINDSRVDNSADANGAPESPESIDATDAFTDDRQLCPDGACTGLIGSDGKCKECGRPAAS